MFKILIIEKDIFQSIKILDYMNNLNVNFKIYGIGYGIEDIMNILLTKDFDLILLDTNINNYNCSKFFDFIQENNFIKYQKSIILFLNSNEIFSNERNNFYVYDYIKKPYDQKNFEKIIIEFLNKNNAESIITKIKAELELLSFNYSYKGTKYLIDCIYQVYLLNNEYNFHLFTDVLPTIAKKYNKSVDCIYANIKNSIKNMYLDCKDDILRQYFNIYEDSKPLPKDLISCILDNIINK